MNMLTLPERPLADAPLPEVKGYNQERVLEVEHWTDRLFSFKTTRPKALRFDSGQFVMIGLMVDGKPLVRAYSIVSASYDDHLEFLSIKVPDGPLTSRLQHIRTGDVVLVGRKPTGTLLLGNMRPGKRLYLLATGTGLAPFGSIIRDPEAYESFEQVIVVYGCRTVAELAFGTRTVMDVRNSELLGEVARDKLKLYTTVTREPYVRQARVTTLIESGEMTRDLGLPDLDASDDRVMICGSPEMLRDLRVMLSTRGFKEGSNAEPGDFVIERAFVER